MAYTDEQLRRYNTKPDTGYQSTVFLFDNSIAGKKGILVSGINGPYENRSFTLDGELIEFLAVRCNAPQVTAQDTDSNDVGQIEFGRIGSDVRQYLSAIKKGALTPADALISVTMAVYEGVSTTAAPIFSRKMYAGGDGVTMDQNNVTITLSVDNPAKSQYLPFYDPAIYTGLVAG